jgi:formate hydrogenlyase subunit 6/NADH:ubiquinone oxidoreductase subunit I
MSQQRILEKKSLDELFGKLTAAGNRVLAPLRNGQRVEFAEVGAGQGGGSPGRDTASQIDLDYIQTARPAKEVVFPRYEHMLRYRLAGKDAQAEEIAPEARPTVLFGLHPCDAASFATLNAVFTWDSPDAYFEPKLAKLTIVGLSCTQGDAYCFCTSVGGGPGATHGSDILLTPIDGKRYLAEIVTEKGAAVVALAPHLFAPANGESEPERQRGATTEPGATATDLKEAVLAQIAPRFAPEQLGQRLPALFPRNGVWVEQSLRCIGCGACAYVCPTCTCFDIQDERQRYAGVRLRCWDSCGFGLFTLHASGHNPRAKQSERWRQRVMHKFSYQPERLGVLGCVGCGRCSRSCPADMNLAQHVEALAQTPT